jgi:glycosyltransferase involved in cell wall biosynthesis
MNILIFSWRGPGHPHSGGAEIVTHEHAKAWVKSGHSITLFTSMFPAGMWEETIDGIEVIRRGNELVTVQIAAYFWYRKHKKEFDLVIDHFHGIPFYTPFYVKTQKIAFIHEVAREVWKLNALPPIIRLIPAFVGPFIERQIFKFYRKIPFITVSDSTKRDLLEYGISDKNITVIQNGVSSPKGLKKYVKEKINTVMYLGPIAKDKGIDDAIQVFARLKKGKQRWQFWIVGKGGNEELSKVKQKVNELEIEKETIFFGYVDEVKKFELLSKAHVLMNPSVHEGWGLVNIESAACGTPVVAYDVHGCRDSIKNGETGILVEKGNTWEMAKQIVTLLENKNKYIKMQKNAKKWSEEFDWDRSTKKSLTSLNDFTK